MDVNTALLTLVTGAVGGGIAAIITYIVNRRDRRDSLILSQLKETTTSVASNARHMLHLAGRQHREEDANASDADLSTAHLQVRSGSNLLALFGDRRVQEAARLVRHHAYAVSAVAQGQPDPRSEDYADNPYTRLENAVELLLADVRRQLGVGGGIVTDFDFEKLTTRAADAHRSGNTV
jgi:hypothetical protein